MSFSTDSKQPAIRRPSELIRVSKDIYIDPLTVVGLASFQGGTSIKTTREDAGYWVKDLNPDQVAKILHLV